LGEWKLEMLPGAGEFESDFGEDNPDRILRIVLTCVLDFDQFGVAVILVPTDEADSVEVGRFLKHISEVNDTDSGEFFGEPEFADVVSEDVIGIVVVERFGAVGDSFAAVGECEVVLVLGFVESAGHGWFFMISFG
jgi:hypothetical protein